jgi:sulfonate transport system permease protein
VFLVAFGVFFPIYLNTYHGIRTVDGGLIEMARVYGLSGFQLFRDLLLPGALPSILVGVRYALGIMWLTLIVAVTVSASSGIGCMTMTAREFLQTDIIVLGIIIYALFGKLADFSTTLVERRCLAWHPVFQNPASALLWRRAHFRMSPTQRARRFGFRRYRKLRSAACFTRAEPHRQTWRVPGNRRP